MAILDKTQINSLATKVDEAVRYGDLKMATELSSLIQKSLSEEGQSDEFKRALGRYLVELKFIRFLGISDEDLLNLLTNNLSESFGIPEFDLIQKFGDRFSLITFPEDQAEFLEKVLKALEGNTEIIGKSSLKLGTKQIKQTIGGWIELYNSTPAKNPLRSQLDVVEFISKNGNSLSEMEKLILNEVLKLYNGTKNWLINYNNLPEPKEDDEIPDDVLLDLMYGPDESAKPSQAAKVNAPVINRNIDGVKSQQAPQIQTKQLRVDGKPTDHPPKELVQSAAEVDSSTAERLSQLLQQKVKPSAPASGLVKKQSVEEVSQDDIDSKLDELKKRLS